MIITILIAFSVFDVPFPLSNDMAFITIPKDINRANADSVVDSLLILGQKRNIKKVVMIICSTGGIVAEALRIISTMKAINKEIITVGYQEVSSSALLIFASGDKRYLRKDTGLTMHLPFIHFRNEKLDVKQLAGLVIGLEKLTRESIEIIHEATGQPKEKIEKDCENGGTRFSAEEALKYGLADTIF
ncbi:ATP-dependent Clp protease proteolytic subunit [bacterium]|nr:ATP-dependent Clp protease proteolytic subunit [bacterium]